MNLLKLLLVAVLATGTMYAADNLEEAFKNGKVDGELRAFYYGRDYNEGATGPNGAISTDSSLLALGLRLSYETEELKGFTVGFGFQGQSTPWASADDKMDHQMPWDLGASGAVLSEAYLRYNFAKTSIKVGRQYFNMPLMSSDNRDVIKQAIEGVTVVNNDVSDTTLYGAYAWSMHWMKDNAINNEFADFGNFGLLTAQGDYAYVVGGINKSLPDTELTLAYGKEDQSHTLLLAQADYTPMVSEGIKLLTGLQYWKTNEDEAKSIAWADSTVISSKLGVNVGPWSVYGAYTNIEDGRSAWGVGMTDDRPRLYTSTWTDAGIYEASTQYAIDTNYYIGSIGTVIGARYVDIDLDSDGENSTIGNGTQDSTSVYAIKDFQGALKGLTCVAFFEQIDNSTDAYDRDELRIRLSYNF